MKKPALFGLETLFLSAGLLLMGNGLQAIFLTLRADLEGFSLQIIGLMGSVYYAGFILGCWKAPQFLTGVGHIRTFAALASVAASCALLHSIWINEFFWIGLRFVSGFCLSGLYVVIESWLNEFSTNSDRGQIISKYRMTDLGCTIIGQFLLLSADPGDFRLFSILAMLIALSLAPVALTQIKSPQLANLPKFNIKEEGLKVWDQAPLGLIGCFFSGLINSSFWMMIPIFTKGILDNTKLLPFMTVAYLTGGILSQGPVGRASDRRDRRIILILVALFSVMASVAMSWMISSGADLKTWVWPLIALFGAGSVPIYSLSITHANDQVKDNNFVGMSSALLMIHSFGLVIGPAFSSNLLSVFGESALFSILGGFHLMLFVYGLYRLIRKRGPRASDLTPYFSIPRTTPLLFRWDPRSNRLKFRNEKKEKQNSDEPN